VARQAPAVSGVPGRGPDVPVTGRYPPDGGVPGGGAGGAGQVEQIISWVDDACSVVPAQAYGGAAGSGSGGTATLYECRASA
jgi:hypothetical protein